MFHCFTFFLVIRFCILRLSLNTPALCPLFHGVSPQGEEKFYQPFVWDNMVGSPPHRRGNADLRVVIVGDFRITPAWAGKSMTAPGRSSRTGNHPRVGGEKCSLSSFLTRCSGSPPHGRGKGNRGFSCVSSKRITPAWAGKRCLLPFLCSDSWDHPRVGGEKVQILLYEDIQKGSPPRGRGKARHLSHGLLPCG